MQRRILKYQIKRALVRLRSFFDIKNDTDIEGTITSIRKNIKLKGFNIWILVASSLLASIGLDTNSTAIIIGAMLISPLMSPILGIGLGVSINDSGMLRSALREFGIAVFLSVLSSTLYFLFSPLAVPNDEILARVKPTILDVGVALFGGVAGIVAGSRQDKTNALPGVAIATALMPPLCVTGFGLATGNMGYAFGSFYLFFINAFFISLSTFVVARYLKFPYFQFVNPQRRKRFMRWMIVILVIITLPSMYIFWDIIHDLREKQRINEFIEENIIQDSDRELMSSEYIKTDTLNHLKVYLVGQVIEQDSILAAEQRLPNYKIENTKLEVVQMDVPEGVRQEITSQVVDIVQKSMKLNQEIEDHREEKIKKLEEELEKIKSDTIPLTSIGEEIRAFQPRLQKIAFAKMKIRDYSLKDSVIKKDDFPTFVIQWKGKVNKHEKRKMEKQIEEFLKQRIDVKELELVYFDD